MLYCDGAALAIVIKCLSGFYKTFIEGWKGLSKGETGLSRTVILFHYLSKIQSAFV